MRDILQFPVHFIYCGISCPEYMITNDDNVNCFSCSFFSNAPETKHTHTHSARIHWSWFFVIKHQYFKELHHKLTKYQINHVKAVFIPFYQAIFIYYGEFPFVLAITFTASASGSPDSTWLRRKLIQYYLMNSVF